MNGRKDKALAALLAYPTHEQAAEAAGIAPRTLRLYLQDEEFRQAYDKRKRQLIALATTQLQQSLTDAIQALRDIIDSTTASDSAKIAAARVLLDHGLKYSELIDLVKRLEAVESVLSEVIE